MGYNFSLCNNIAWQSKTSSVATSVRVLLLEVAEFGQKRTALWQRDWRKRKTSQLWRTQLQGNQRVGQLNGALEKENRTQQPLNVAPQSFREMIINTSVDSILVRRSQLSSSKTKSAKKKKNLKVDVSSKWGSVVGILTPSPLDCSCV